MIYKKFEDKILALPELPAASTVKNWKIQLELIEALNVAMHDIDDEFKDALRQEYGQKLTDKAHQLMFDSEWAHGNEGSYRTIEESYLVKVNFFLELEEANRKP